jgi:hypothetical protein
LKTPITLKEFEDLPFVRSLFFRYGLYFPDENTKAVMVTDSTGKSLPHPFSSRSRLTRPQRQNCRCGDDAIDVRTLRPLTASAILLDNVFACKSFLINSWMTV